MAKYQLEEVSDTELVEEEFDIQELGTIEEVSYRENLAEKRAKERRDSFYDRNSISKYRPKSMAKQEKEFYDKKPQTVRDHYDRHRVYED